MLHPVPKRSTVFPGCLLPSIVAAIKAAEYFLSGPSHQWYENTYYFDGGDGDSAAITFSGNSLVGVVFNHDSDRNPFRDEAGFDPLRYFRGMPVSHQPLADRSLWAWSADLHEGKTVPLITAAFWDQGEYLAGAEPWDVIWEHGACRLRRQFMEDQEKALAEWQMGYNLSPEQTALARSLFRRKMEHPTGLIELSPEDLHLMFIPADNSAREMEDLARMAFGGKSALDVSRHLFAAIGIQLPEISQV